MVFAEVGRARDQVYLGELIFFGAMAGAVEEVLYNRQHEDDEQALPFYARASGIPFMQLPTRLPQRLKQLIPYQLALEIRCAPVGRDQQHRIVPQPKQPLDLGVQHEHPGHREDQDPTWRL